MSESLDQGRAMPRRRTVVAAAGAVGAAGLTASLAACGSDEPSSDTPSANGSGAALKVSDVPVGGGKILKDEKVVVTQPAAGEFKAFSAVCTHQGCVVSSVSDGTINCACHGSRFSVEDGSVKNGPATKPLPSSPVSVDGQELKLG
ncbi:Rieske (2Fe-2S) protein [Streptomyces polyrhachis]|uniref:Cytochrome bc1 complex Rieske iron-sulfur subunit n=1 Tax=Streptomyces polyrhachis TaxID=1282885 RepID=A0ABW2G814_9ACTN